MFKAYVDESGIHSTAKIFVLAGYLAAQKEWKRFEKKWQDVLDNYEIKVFHASDCNSNTGEFARFDGKQEEKNQFVKELLTTISDRSRIIPINVGVVVRDFPDPEHGRVLARGGHPYYVCMKAFMSTVTLVMRRFPAHERVALIFDRQDQFDQRAHETFDGILSETWEGRERFKTLEFGSRQDNIPLQAADSLAFDSYREFLRRRDDPDRPARRSYALLTKNRAMSSEWVLDQIGAQEFYKLAQQTMDDSENIPANDPGST